MMTERQRTFTQGIIALLTPIIQLAIVMTIVVFWYAIWNGFDYWGVPKWCGFIFSVLSTPIPIWGSIVATTGAIHVWKWDPYLAIIAFWFPYALSAILGFFAFMSYRASKRKN